MLVAAVKDRLGVGRTHGSYMPLLRVEIMIDKMEPFRHYFVVSICCSIEHLHRKNFSQR
jgi:hypothetical protein